MKRDDMTVPTSKEQVTTHVKASHDKWRKGLAMNKRNAALGKPIEVLSSVEIIVTNDLFMDDLTVIRTPLDEMEKQIHMAIDIPTVRLLIMQDGLINTMVWPVQSGMVESIKDTYASADELPEWMQLKLAALMLLDAEEPSKKEVVNVGRRISESIFWIYLDDGSNTGKESKDQST
jgi:hypothetical protein